MHLQLRNRIILLAGLYLLMMSGASAQDGCYTCSRDSLLKQLSIARKTAEKIKLLQWIIDFSPATDSANYYIEQLISLDESLNSLNLAPYRKIHLANVHRMKNNNDSALQLFHQAVTEFDQQQKKIPNLLLGFRNLYNLLNRQEERYRYYKAKLDYYLLKGPYENTAPCYHGIAGYFTYTADYNQAISYYLKGAEVFKKFYPYWYYNAMGIIGVYYAEWGNYTKALSYINFALPKIKATKGVLETANGYYEFQLAQIKLVLMKYDEVLQHAQILINTFQATPTNRFYLIGLLYRGLALVYSGDAKSAYPLLVEAKKLNEQAHGGRMTTFNSTLEIDYGLFYYFKHLKDYKTAETHLLSAYQKAVAEKTNNLQLKYLTELADVTARQGKFGESRNFTQTYIKLKNELEKQQAPYRIAQYENEQKDIAQLQKINVLKEEQAAQQAVISKRNTILVFSFIALFLIILFMIFLYRQLQINKKTLSTLKETQTQLIQSEKMASLGQLTAGIAHEIQNPLNFVNNFSDVNKELITEMKDEIEKGNFEEVKALATDIEDNEQKINHHGKRADAIVKGMLQHSGKSSEKKEPTDINALADEYLRLSYHGLRAKDKSFNPSIETNFDPGIGKIEVVPQDLGRVLLNLYTNAFYAVNEKKKACIVYGEKYEPTVSVTTTKSKHNIKIVVKDTGNGISKKVVDKIFQPFFTTKPTGQGTGLGLSLSYDIVKAHGGELKVETKEGEGAEFIIQLPVTKLSEV